MLKLNAFPWKLLPKSLAAAGVILNNLPEGIPFPGEKQKKRSKGLGDLSGIALKKIVDALCDPDAAYPMRFEVYKGARNGPSLPRTLQSKMTPDGMYWLQILSRRMSPSYIALLLRLAQNIVADVDNLPMEE